MSQTRPRGGFLQKKKLQPAPMANIPSSNAPIRSPLRRSPRGVSFHDNDDDDFVEPVPLRPRVKLAGRKRQNYSSTSRQTTSRRKLLETIPEVQEEGDGKKSGKTCCRCNPQDVLDAISIMSDIQKAKIDELGWGKILDITIDAVASRELFMWLLPRIDTINMMLRVPPHTALPIDKHAVQTVLGVPAGTMPRPQHSYNNVNAERAQLARALGCPAGKITIAHLKAKLQEHKDDDLSIRCFFLILFNRLLFSTTSVNICNTEVQYTMDWGNFAKVDWQQAILDDLRSAANNWKAPGPKSANPSLSSCPPFLIICYLDNLMHTENHDNRMVTPRAALFTKKKVGTIRLADRWKDAHGVYHYGALPQLSQIGSAYFNVHGAPATAGPAHPPDPCALPLMSELLKGYTGKVTGRKLVQFTDLVACLDTDIRANQRAMHQATCDRMLKFADDVKALLDGPSTCEPPTQPPNITHDMNSLQRMVDFGRQGLDHELKQELHDESLDVSANNADQQAQRNDENVTKRLLTRSKRGISKKHKVIAMMSCTEETGSVHPESRCIQANVNGSLAVSANDGDQQD